MADVERVKGAAMRRRERRLRSWLKHERQTVRMVLAETFHHSSAPFASGWEGTCSTTACGDRTRQGAGRPRTIRRGPEWLGIRRSSVCVTRKTPCGVRGLPSWQSRRSRRSAFSSTPWSSLLRSLPCYRFSTILCRRRWYSWWTS